MRHSSDDLGVLQKKNYSFFFSFYFFFQISEMLGQLAQQLIKLVSPKKIIKKIKALGTYLAPQNLIITTFHI